MIRPRNPLHGVESTVWVPYNMMKYDVNPLHGVESFSLKCDCWTNICRIHYMELKVASSTNSSHVSFTRIHYMELKGSRHYEVEEVSEAESITWS